MAWEERLHTHLPDNNGNKFPGEHRTEVPVISILSLIFLYLMQKYFELIFPVWTTLYQETFEVLIVRENKIQPWVWVHQCVSFMLLCAHVLSIVRPPQGFCFSFYFQLDLLRTAYQKTIPEVGSDLCLMPISPERGAAEPRAPCPCPIASPWQFQVPASGMIPAFPMSVVLSHLILSFDSFTGELRGLHDSYFTTNGGLPLCPLDQDFRENEDWCGSKCPFHLVHVTMF